jgi:hypothetical protein
MKICHRQPTNASLGAIPLMNAKASLTPMTAARQEIIKMTIACPEAEPMTEISVPEVVLTWTRVCN